MSVTARHDRAKRVARPAGALLVRPRPIPGEAAAGYVIRVAQANGLQHRVSFGTHSNRANPPRRSKI